MTKAITIKFRGNNPESVTLDCVYGIEETEIGGIGFFKVTSYSGVNYFAASTVENIIYLCDFERGWGKDAKGVYVDEFCDFLKELNEPRGKED